jgi:uroporphyrinogen-III decarboxylase
LNQGKLYSIFDYLDERIGDQFSIHGEITSPFDYFLDLLGYQNGLMALMFDPEKCKQILARFTEGVKKIAVGMCQKNIDAIKISSPFAGMGFISPEFYTDFVLPFESEIIATIRQLGKHVYIHTCGSIDDRLELMRRSGASGLECLDPVPVGNVDLEDAFRRIGDSMFIKGNIDSVNTLLNGDDEKMRNDVRKIIETGKYKGKGFILSTACSIAPLVPKKRILKLSEIISEFGFY